MHASSQTTGCASAVRPDRSEGGHLPANGAERGELQFRGVLVIVVTGGRGGLVRALLTATAETFQEGPTEGFAEAEEEDRRDAGLEEQKELADDIKKVHCLLGNPRSHVRSNDVADVFGNNAKSI